MLTVVYLLRREAHESKEMGKAGGIEILPHLLAHFTAPAKSAIYKVLFLITCK